MHPRIALLLTAFACYGTVCAQRAFFDGLGVDQGLSSKVYAVVEDADGRIWIGTEAGITRYDGISLENFSSDKGAADNGARTLFRDGEGRLWAGHLGGGLSVYDGRKFHKAAFKDVEITVDVTGIQQDKDGHLWVTTFGQGAFRFLPGSDLSAIAVEQYGAAQGVDDRLVGMLMLRNGTLCVLDAGGRVKQWDGRSFADRAFPGLPEIHRITSLFEDQRGGLWVGTFTGGAYRFDPKGGPAEVYDIGSGIPSNFVFCFGEDAMGQVWVGTWDGGAARIEEKGITVFTPGNGLRDKAVRCITRDREGNMLLGTNEQGLEIFKGEQFTNFTEADGLVDPQVWTVMEDTQGRLWFGTNGGITILDPGTGVGGTVRVRNLTMQQGELTSNRVRALRSDLSGNVWIGTENGGLFVFDPRTYRFRYDTEISGSIPENKVTALEVGRRGELWVGTINGLVRFTPGQPPMVYRADDGLSGSNITALYRDAEGVLWVGSALRGLSRVENGTVSALDLGRAFTATCMVKDAKGRMWVGTEGQGLLVVENGRIVEEHTVEKGLLSNTIKSLVSDRNGHVWVGTIRGLNRWDPERGTITSYTDRAGFLGIEAKPNACWLTQRGDIWFGTAKGATRVALQRNAQQPVPPVVGFRSLRVNLEDRPVEDGLSLSHSESNIRIGFGSVSLSDPSAVQYRYMLAGLERDWQPLTTETDAHYPALPPGTYTFKVQAVNRAGLFSEPPAELHFTILPPWYRSWWFYSALVVAIGGGLFSYIKIRERQLRLRNLVLERTVEKRTAEVVAQSREIEGQKERIEDLLLNILPKEVSEELKEKGKATARLHGDVTVLFTDMKGFTQAAERMTPEELVHELDECFIHFDEIVGRYGIEKIKTIGDSYMCAAGVPTSDPQHAAKCALAALEVRDLMDQWRRRREAEGKIPWVLRIGLHSGPVVAGVVGRRKFAYDIWGDTVNTASRMESSGIPGEVNVSGTTHALLKDRFICEHRGQVEAKNKGAIDMYLVKGIREGWCAKGNSTLPNERFLRELGLGVPKEQLA